MNKRQTEYIALYLFVFGAILLFGVLARKFVLVKGYDEFSAAVGFFATVVVLSALYISLQMTLNELLLPRMEKFLMRRDTRYRGRANRGGSCYRDNPTAIGV